MADTIENHKKWIKSLSKEEYQYYFPLTKQITKIKSAFDFTSCIALDK